MHYRQKRIFEREPPQTVPRALDNGSTSPGNEYKSGTQTIPLCSSTMLFLTKEGMLH